MVSDEGKKPNMLLRRQRQQRGWSLKRVAEELCCLCEDEGRLPGVNENIIGKWERGVKRPAPFYREKFCQLYGLSAEQLGFIDNEAVLQQSTQTEIAVPLPSMRTAHVSEEERIQLNDGLGTSVAMSWKLFQHTSVSQMLAIGQSHLFLVQHTHALLYPSVRSLLYTGVYSQIGMALHLQERDEEALQAYQSAYIAALAAGDPWYVAQSLICQSDSYHALGQYDLAIQMIEEALRIIGKPSHNALICAKAHLLTCWADNAMMLQDYTIAQEKLDAAAIYLDQIAPNEEFDRAAWLLLAGKYALLTNDFATAIRNFEEALQELPEQWMLRRIMTATGLAMGYARMKERESSLAVAEKLIPKLQIINASMTNHWFNEYLQQDLSGAFRTDARVRAFIADTYQQIPQLIGVSGKK